MDLKIQIVLENFLVNLGGDNLTLQELGGWKSRKVAGGYLGEIFAKKVSIAQKIQNNFVL